MVNISVLPGGQARTRAERRPNFPIAGTMKPFGLYPLMAHPVLPGETLQSFNSKWRVLSKPVKHPLSGCWLETWLVYVKFTDLDRELGEMFVSNSFPTTGYTASADAPRYFVKNGQIDWMKRCTERLHEAFFRHENEPIRLIDGVPQVKLNAQSWYQNAMFSVVGVPATSDALTDNQSVDQLTGFEMMQRMAMSELTYEKYLEQYGVQSIRTQIGEPEILRYGRSWVMPVNTVDPSTGLPSSAWVWNDEMKAEKPKRFDEPGFVLMLAAVRPKLFQGNLGGSFVGNLWGFVDWYPLYNHADPEAGVRPILRDDPAIGAGARVGGQVATKELWYDHRDLLSHGEQFINTATHPFRLPVSTGLSWADAAPVEDIRGEYAKLVDVDDLFVSALPADRFCYYEGIAQARISGHITDTTR